jgi:hypothetical protein
MAFRTFTHPAITFEELELTSDNPRIYEIHKQPRSSTFSFYDRLNGLSPVQIQAADQLAKQAPPPTPPPPSPPPVHDAKSDRKLALGLALLYIHHDNGTKPTVQSLVNEMGVPRDALYRNLEFRKLREKANELFGLFQPKNVR